MRLYNYKKTDSLSSQLFVICPSVWSIDGSLNWFDEMSGHLFENDRSPVHAQKQWIYSRTARKWRVISKWCWFFSSSSHPSIPSFFSWQTNKNDDCVMTVATMLDGAVFGVFIQVTQRTCSQRVFPLSIDYWIKRCNRKNEQFLIWCPTYFKVR